MKKAVLILSIIGVSFLIACGPSAKDKAAAEQARLDSIAAVEVEQARLDSIAEAEATARQAAREDSLVRAAAAAGAQAAQQAQQAAQPVKAKPIQGRPGAVRK